MLWVMMLVLCSLNTITKEATMMARRLRQASPHPGLGPQVELRGRHTSSLFDLFGIGKTLPGEGITTEESPPALLQIEPARPRGDKDLMDAWMPFQPGARLEAVMAAEVISDNEDLARQVVGFNVGQQGDVALGIARSRTSGHLLAIAHP